MNGRNFSCVVLLVALMAPTALARKWTDASGKYSTEADFIEVKDGNVILKKANGKVISVPLEKLSTADQEFIKSKTNTDAELAYDRVVQDIAAHTGKRVTWIASQATSSHSTNTKTGEETQTYVYLAQDKEGNFFADYPFIFSHPGTWKDTRRTPAARKADNTSYEPGIKKVTGIIAGSTEYRQPSGAVSAVPALKDVTLDIPSDRQSFQILKKYIDSTSNPTWAQHRVDAFVAVYSDSDLVADAKQLMTKYK